MRKCEPREFLTKDTYQKRWLPTHRLNASCDNKRNEGCQDCTTAVSLPNLYRRFCFALPACKDAISFCVIVTEGTLTVNAFPCQCGVYYCNSHLNDQSALGLCAHLGRKCALPPPLVSGRPTAEAALHSQQFMGQCKKKNSHKYHETTSRWIWSSSQCINCPKGSFSGCDVDWKRLVCMQQGTQHPLRRSRSHERAFTKRLSDEISTRKN